MRTQAEKTEYKVLALPEREREKNEIFVRVIVPEKDLAAVIMAGVVIVFDFDKTIIDCDSDNWVVDELGATDLFNQLLPTMPWNSLMVFFFSVSFTFD